MEFPYSDLSLYAQTATDLLAERVPLWQLRVNVVRALGDLRNDAAAPALIEAIADPNPNVAVAAMAATGASYAIPHAKRCGFMTDSHVHSITPTHGRRSAMAAATTTIARTSRSRMGASSTVG